MQNSPSVLVYGAYGHTGRFVSAELRARGYRPVLSGRSALKLAELVKPGDDVHAVDLNDAAALQHAARGCCAVLNCAGPFADTSGPLIEAALRARLPYLDVSAEPDVIAENVRRYHGAAREAGIPVLLAVAFYGALGDALTDIARGEWADADRVTIAIGLNSWHPTAGTRAAVQRTGGRRWVYADGSLQCRTDTPALSVHVFPEPLGEQAVMLDYPGPEGVLVPRWLRTPNVQISMAVPALRDLLDPDTPAPRAAAEGGRSEQRFVVHVQVERAGVRRAAWASGQDIYATTAPLIVSALTHVLASTAQPAGVLSIGEVVDARRFLQGLTPEHIKLSVLSH